MNILGNCMSCLKPNKLLTMIIMISVGVGVQTDLVQAQGAYRYEMVGHWNDTNLVSQNTPFSNAKQTWSDLMGWSDARNNRKYIIMGSIDSIYFFDVTNPDSIRKCGVFWGKNRVINRDIEVYQHYAYCVSDNGPDGAFQLFDLQYLPDSVRLVKEDTAISRRTHSLFIDSVSKRMYMNSTNSTFAAGRDGMQVFSLEDPENPTYMGRLEDINGVCGRVHEAYFRNDTAYCSCEYNGLQIFDLRNINNQTHLGGITPPYPFNGYNHTSWLSDNGKHLVFTDELPYGLPIKLYDVSDVQAPDYLLNFNSTAGATPHNVIWIGNKLFTSAYEDGMWVWDMTNINAPTVYGYYDTYPQNDEGVFGGLSGCWGVYPFFSDGIIAASDMTNGLFLLRFNQQVSVTDVTGKKQATMQVYPNPFEDELNLAYSGMESELVYYKLFNSQGKLITEGSQMLVNGRNELPIQNADSFTVGMYFLQLTTSTHVLNQTLIKQ